MFGLISFREVLRPKFRAHSLSEAYKPKDWTVHTWKRCASSAASRGRRRRCKWRTVSSRMSAFSSLLTFSPSAWKTHKVCDKGFGKLTDQWMKMNVNGTSLQTLIKELLVQHQPDHSVRYLLSSNVHQCYRGYRPGANLGLGRLGSCLGR